MHGDSDHLEEEQVGTASFLVTHRQVEGGNRMLEVRDPLFHWRGETPRPWEFPGDKGTTVPWSHPDSKSPLCFPTAIPQEFCLETPENWMEDNEELEQKSKNMEVIYCQGTFNFTESSKLHFFFPLCAISQGFSVPYQFLLGERVKLHTVLITEITGRGTCLDSFQ